ncbi:hypothetical protein LUZ61_020457 [Rhynchospora tenuis]|uniref:Rhodanese domain-containing protein n=1 Tax=Rhynchospora tenuis TaxID=198213 RepID=A0AAD6ENV3_9POAL|nr:hypothetical protein LUZ61_020457 [Rhynchospora tenuis]
MAGVITGVSFPVLIAPRFAPRLQQNLSGILRPLKTKHQVISTKKLSSTAVRCDVRNWSLRSGPESVQLEVPTSVPVRVAKELLQAGHRYLDVRTEDEFKAGHPSGAINIPYMFKVGSGMSKNPKFLDQVSSIFSQDDEIIVGCQSGKRSLMAATELHSAGFKAVVDLAGGYSAWSQNELPIERS